jgi:hypothetical protein
MHCAPVNVMLIAAAINAQPLHAFIFPHGSPPSPAAPLPDAPLLDPLPDPDPPPEPPPLDPPDTLTDVPLLDPLSEPLLEPLAEPLLDPPLDPLPEPLWEPLAEVASPPDPPPPPSSPNPPLVAGPFEHAANAAKHTPAAPSLTTLRITRLLRRRAVWMKPPAGATVAQ